MNSRYLFFSTILLVIIILRAASVDSGFQNSSILSDPIAYLRPDDFSLATYYSFGNESLDYKEFDIDKLHNESRRFLFGLFDLYHWGRHGDIVSSCFYIQTTYRNAITDLRRYYSRRVLYRNTLEYEVGYLTYEIIWRYQTMLELFDYGESRFLKYYWRDVVPLSLLFYLYTNVLKHATSIIHLCNMMHELERKYKATLEFGVFDDYSLHKGSQRPEGNAPEVDAAQAAYDAYLNKLKKEEKKKRKEAKRKQKEMQKLGSLPTKGRSTKRKSRFPLHYGWSIENW